MEIILNSKLSNYEKNFLILFTSVYSNGIPEMYFIFGRGNTDTLKAFANPILDSKLEDKQKYYLLSAQRPDGISGMCLAIHNKKINTINSFIDLILDSSLSHCYKKPLIDQGFAALKIKLSDWILKNGKNDIQKAVRLIRIGLTFTAAETRNKAKIDTCSKALTELNALDIKSDSFPTKAKILLKDITQTLSKYAKEPTPRLFDSKFCRPSNEYFDAAEMLLKGLEPSTELAKKHPLEKIDPKTSNKTTAYAKA